MYDLPSTQPRRYLIWLGYIGAMTAVAVASARGGVLNSKVRIDDAVVFKGPGLPPFPFESAEVGLNMIVVRELFAQDGYIDIQFQAHDEGGETAELYFYQPMVFNATGQPWLGFELEFGFEDPNGHFIRSNSADGLGFALIDPNRPPFRSNVFTQYELLDGHEGLLWSGGTAPSPSNSLYLFRIVVPASNPHMPGFALTDDGYRFTLRQRPMTSWAEPAQIPEPSSLTLAGIGLACALGRSALRGRSRLHQGRRNAA